MVRIAIYMLAAFLTGCDAIDMTGFVSPPSADIDKRFEQSMRYISQNAVPSATAQEAYSFYVCTDVHVNGTSRNLDRFMDSLRSDGGAAFGLILGDVIDSRGMMSVFADALAFRPATQPRNLPVFVTLGNHDTFYSQWDDFRELFGASAYYIEVRSGTDTDLFIALDSASGTLGAKQARWLRDFLAGSRKQYRHCIVFTHTNFFKTDGSQGASGNFPLEETLALSELFDRHDVALVLQGHDHYREELLFRDVRYVIVGALEDGVRRPEYLRVTVSADGLEYDWKYL